MPNHNPVRSKAALSAALLLPAAGLAVGPPAANAELVFNTVALSGAPAPGVADGAEINGLRHDNEGNTILKAKSSVYTKEGEVRFGRVFDATGKDTDVNPYKNDTVRLRLSPFRLDNGSVSFFLNAVQIIEKLEYTGSGGGSGFDAVEGGFDSGATTAADAPEEVSSEDMPF